MYGGQLYDVICFIKFLYKLFGHTKLLWKELAYANRLKGIAPMEPHTLKMWTIVWIPTFTLTWRHLGGQSYNLVFQGFFFFFFAVAINSTNEANKAGGTRW